MKAKHIMTQPPQTCTVDMNLAAASRRMKETGSGTLAVLNRHGRLAGIVTDRDLALAIGDARDLSVIAVAKVMSHPVHTCEPDEDVHAVLDTMSRFKVRRLPVVGEEGAVDGMISIDDIILWGVPRSAVSLRALVTALRSLCSASTATVLDRTDL